MPHEFEKAVFFEGCLPIEELVGRGVDTLRFGPMKPVDLTTLLFDAQNVAEGPIARLPLRNPIPPGFHAVFDHAMLG